MLVRLATLILLVAFPLSAFQSRLVDSSGQPVAGAQISVVDQRMNARTDADGRFTMAPDPKLPATLVIIGSRGELFPPITVDALSA